MKPNHWKGQRVLVTGVAGFVGSWLAHTLVGMEAQVLGLVRDVSPVSNFQLLKLSERITVVRGELENLELLVRLLNEYEIDYCFHLAAQSLVGVAHRSPISTFRSNVDGSLSLLEACRLARPNCRVIVASSDKAYGAHDSLPYREDFALRPVFPYEVSKACADLVARSYHHTFGLPVVVTRLANLYGGGDLNFSRLIPDTCRSLVLNQNPVIRSDGSLRRDYVYIDDAVEFYLKLAQHAADPGVAGEAFNAGAGEPRSVLEVVDKLLELSGKRHLKAEIHGKGTPNGEIPHQFLDSTKVKNQVGWQPRTSLEDGLQKTLAWYDQRRGLLERVRAERSHGRYLTVGS